MTKQIVNRVLERSLDLTGRVEDVIEELQGYLDRYPTKVMRIELDESYDEYEVYHLFETRIETDAEYANRLASEAAAEKREREQYEKLKKKYGEVQD